MMILNPSHHSCQHVNQILRRAIPDSIRNTSQRICYHIKCFDDEKEFNDDDIAQIFIDTLEKNIKEIYKRFKFPKSMIMTMNDKLVIIIPLFVTSVMKNSVKIECVVIVICLASLEVLLMIFAT